MVQRFNFNELTNIGAVANPVLAQDVATKNYIDSLPGKSFFDSISFAPSGNTLALPSAAGSTTVVIAGDVRANYTLQDTLAFSNSQETPRYTLTSMSFVNNQTTLTFAPALVVAVAVNTAIFKVSVVRTLYSDLVVTRNLSGSVSNNTLTLFGSDDAPNVGGYLQFTSANAGSANQQFINQDILNYGNVLNITLMVNGVALTPLEDYTLSGNTITVLDYLSPQSLIQIIAKNVASRASGTVTVVGTGAGLTGGPITTTGTVSMLPATTSSLGGVIVDGNSLAVTPSGTLSVLNAGSANSILSLPVAPPPVAYAFLQVNAAASGFQFSTSIDGGNY